MKKVWISVLIGFVVWLVFFGVMMAALKFVSLPEWANGGAQLGDSFGIINSLFSALALAGLVYSLILQRQDFRRISSLN